MCLCGDWASAQRVYWKVTVYTREETAESELEDFEMGLLREEEWKCQWIEPEDEIDPAVFKPAPYLRKVFTVENH